MRILARSFALTAAAVALTTTAAQAASITYVGPDHNVYLSSPDGSVKRQLTTDGSASLPYEKPSQADDGMVVAVGEGTQGSDGTKFAYFLRPDGTLIETQPLPVPSGIVRLPALTGGHVAPGGGLYLYDWGQAPFGNGSNRYATSLIGRVQSLDACGLRCTDGWVSPRWVDGSVYLVIDHYLGADGVGVQTTSTEGATSWFNLGAEDAVSSVDEAAGRMVLEAVDPAVGTMLDVVIDKPTTALVMVTYAGAPGSGLPSLDCELTGFSEDPAYPRLSPDGRQLAWSTGEGVFVSPVPPETGGGTCTLQPKLIAPGGSRPDWGPADVPVPPPPGPTGGGTGSTPGAPSSPTGPTGAPADAAAACAKAKRKLKKAKRNLARAKRSGSRAKVRRAKKRVSLARKVKRSRC